MAAIEVYPWALNCVPAWRITKAMCRKALLHPDGNWLVLRCVPKHLRSAEMCALAVQRDGESLTEVPVPLRTRDLCLAALATGVRGGHSDSWGRLLRAIPSELREEEDIAKEIAHAKAQHH